MYVSVCFAQNMESSVKPQLSVLSMTYGTLKSGLLGSVFHVCVCIELARDFSSCFDTEHVQPIAPNMCLYASLANFEYLVLQ